MRDIDTYYLFRVPEFVSCSSFHLGNYATTTFRRKASRKTGHAFPASTDVFPPEEDEKTFLCTHHKQVQL
jgi:hypothetical protein